MSRTGIIDALTKRTNAQVLYHGVMVGEVISTADPKQEGRVQAFVPSLDHEKSDAVPWAMQCSPFSGVTQDMQRGRGGETSAGPVAYGLWAMPKVGARVIIMCLNGDPSRRIWIGTLPTFLANHTMPHGRYLDDPQGPTTSVESPIQPLHTTQQQRFENEFAPVQGFESEEYKTRGRDNQVSAVAAQEIGTRSIYSTQADSDGSGYGNTLLQNQEGVDSNIYSMTTPGFHSWSMDDNPTSCRIVMRTTSGHQILMDDTNERVIIATAEGKTWIEMDEKGTIDIYSEADVSVRSKSDINLTADKTVRIAGKEGIHMVSQGEIRMHSGEDTHIKADGNLRTLTDGDWFANAIGDIHTFAEGSVRTKAATIFFEADTNINLQTTSVEVGNALNVQGTIGVTGTLQATGTISSVADVLTSTHSLNRHTHTYILPKIPAKPPVQPGVTLPQLAPSGTAAPATAAPEPSDALESETFLAFFPSRVPQHEPYARVWLDLEQTDVDDGTLVIFDAIDVDPDSVSEFPYTDTAVGTGSPSRGINFQRNANWRR